jgi:hypothetical protein
MGYIFVSYARDDARKVKRVIEKFKAHGLEFWQDTNNIRTGKEWPEEITKAIYDCSRFLLFMSAASMASDNVKREVQIAYEKKKKIIILRLDNAKLTTKLSYQLIGIQRTDYRSPEWETKIVSELGGGKKFFQKPTVGPNRPPPSIKSLPKKPRRTKSVIVELERKFSENRTYYRDECNVAILQLDELRSVAGAHWINPALAYKELVSREHLLDKIEVIQNLIRDFQETGSSIKRELIHNELKALILELDRKVDK